MIIRGYRVHCCLLNLVCWTDWWQFGMPMRLHLGERFWTIPLLNGESRREGWEPVAALTQRPDIEAEIDANPEEREQLLRARQQILGPTLRTFRCEHHTLTGPFVGRPTTTLCRCEMQEVTP